MTRSSRSFRSGGGAVLILLCGVWLGAGIRAQTLSTAPVTLTVDGNFAASNPSGGEFVEIQEALNYIADNYDGSAPYRVDVHAGVYPEFVSISTPNVTLHGTSSGAVIVTAVSDGNGSPLPLLRVDASNVTVQNITFDAVFNDVAEVKYNILLDIADGDDDITIRGCRALNAYAAVQVKPTNSTSDFNDRIVLQGNRFQGSDYGLFVKDTEPGIERGRIDLTSRDNSYVIRSVPQSIGAVGLSFSNLGRESSIRSIGDVVDVESSVTSGSQDVQAFFFFNRQPNLSVIDGATVRLAHTGRTSSLQSFLAVKIHGTTLTLGDPPRVVHVRDIDVRIEDPTPSAVGGQASVFGNWANGVQILVSGGAISWDVDPASGLERYTYVTGDLVTAPSGIYFAGFPFDGIKREGNANLSEVAALDQGLVRASTGLVGSDPQTIVTVDDIPQLNADQTVAGDWTFSGETSFVPRLNVDGAAAGQAPGIDLQGVTGDWAIDGGTNLHFETTSTETKNISFRNLGSGNLNVRFGNGTMLPAQDAGTWLGSPSYRWSQIHGVHGRFTHSLGLPADSTPALGDSEIAIDPAGNRLCVGIGSNTYCASLTCIDCP